MKKLYNLGVALGIVATFGFSSSAFASMPEPTNITYYLNDQPYCYFVGGGNPGIPCNLSEYEIGEYSNGVLTLNFPSDMPASVAGGTIRVSADQANELTIRATSDITAAIKASKTNLTLEFGEHSLSTPADTGETSFENLIIKSGTINIPKILASSLTMTGGTLNLNPPSPYSALSITNSIDISDGEININNGDGIISAHGSFNISGGIINATNTKGGISADDGIEITGGTINIPESSIAFSSTSGGLSISGGIIDVKKIETTGISVTENVEITGGTISLKSAQNPAGFGINLRQGKNFTISGDSQLTIDGFKWGISGKNSKIYFNGGTTSIKNSKEHSVWIVPAVDPENDIVFGKDMGIKENTYVFWEDDDGTSASTGIAESGTVTIAKGYTYRRHHGWESIDGDNSEGIKVPDTGMFSSDDGNSTMMVVSLGLLALVSGGAYLAQYVARRYHNNMKFKK